MSSFNNILCPTDFTACSDEACAYAAELARENKAKLTLLHVVGHFPQERSNEEIAPENKDPMAYRREKAMADLKQQAGRTGCGDADLAVTFSSHASAYGIISYAATAGVDLIVIATHAHKCLEHLFSDTAAYVERKAGCEVMVVKTDDHE